MLRYIKHTILSYSYAERMPMQAIDSLLYRFSTNKDIGRADLEYLKQAVRDTDPRLISTRIISRLSEIEKRMIYREKHFYSSKLVGDSQINKRCAEANGRHYLRARFVKGSTKVR